ncbi:hypothetical protein CDL60_19730 [Roseateles noduli]|nr:hypothetical protein CDL60_19730 [Roseateles noduli]
MAAAQCKFDVMAHRQNFARQSPAAGQCAADGWNLCDERLNGDFDLDTPTGQELLRRLIAQQPSVLDTLRSWEPATPAARIPMRTAAPRPGPGPRPEDDLPPWLREYLFGQWGGNGLASEIRSGSVSPANIIGNTLAATQAVAYGGVQGQTAVRLNAAASQIASGAAKSVRINDFMDLYNANQGKGRPRLRLRIRNLPVTVAAPIAGASWRTNAKGTTHSTRWASPSAAQVKGAGVAAAETKWARSMGWSSGKVGTGLITFAPTAALDAWSSIEFDVDASGRRQLRSFDTNKFLVTSARNQSGNAVGLAASIISVPTAVAIAGVAGLTIAGAPLVIIGLLAGVAMQVVWNNYGGADFAEQQARNALGVPR